MLSLRVLFFGKVQGVGFRYFIRRTALKKGLNGWIRNLNDGSVEALFEGEDEILSSYICGLEGLDIRFGPKVERIKVLEQNQIDKIDFEGFKITG
jgi:acylphosphatase